MYRKNDLSYTFYEKDERKTFHMYHIEMHSSVSCDRLTPLSNAHVYKTDYVLLFDSIGQLTSFLPLGYVNMSS